LTSNWKTTTLGSHCYKIGSGATPRGGSKVYLEQGETALIRSQNIYNAGFDYGGLVYIDKVSAEKLNNVIVKKNDVLLNITGDSVARACIVPNDLVPARVNQHVAIIRPKADQYNPFFVWYWLISKRTQEWLLMLASSGATRNALTKSMIENLEVPQPHIGAQNYAAQTLNYLTDQVHLNHQTNQTLESIALTIFKSWFVDFDPVKAKMEGCEPEGMDAKTASLFPDKLVESELGMIPEGWEVGSFGSVSKCYDSKRIPLSKLVREKRSGDYPYHGATSIMDYVNDYIFDGKYVLMGEDGSVVNDDGSPFLQYVWGQIWVNNHAHVLQGTNSVSTEQLYLFLSIQNISPFTTGAVQLKLNQRNMNSIPFVKAKKEINRAFDMIIQPIFDLIRSNADESITLTHLRDTLLPKLISGEIQIPTE
jgi:type I restriction enzyme, S subunit